MATSDSRSRNRARLTRKELKAPDEFLTMTGHVLGFAAKHLRSISLLVGGVLACVIVVWGVRLYLQGVEQKAFARLAAIEEQLRTAGDSEVLPSELVERLQQVAQTWGAGEAGGYATLYLGHVYYRKGDYAAATQAYQQSLARANKTSLLRPLAMLGTGYALEAAGEVQQAQDAYQRLLEANPAGLVMEAYLGKGRAAEASHDFDGAIAAYSAMAEKFPVQAETLGISEKLEGLRDRRSSVTSSR